MEYFTPYRKKCSALLLRSFNNRPELLYRFRENVALVGFACSPAIIMGAFLRGLPRVARPVAILSGAAFGSLFALSSTTLSEYERRARADNLKEERSEGTQIDAQDKETGGWFGGY